MTQLLPKNTEKSLKTHAVHEHALSLSQSTKLATNNKISEKTMITGGGTILVTLRAQTIDELIHLKC